MIIAISKYFLTSSLDACPPSMSRPFFSGSRQGCESSLVTMVVLWYLCYIQLGWLSAFLKIYISVLQQASDLDDTVEEKLLVGDRPKQSNDPNIKLPWRVRLFKRSQKELDEVKHPLTVQSLTIHFWFTRLAAHPGRTVILQLYHRTYRVVGALPQLHATLSCSCFSRGS